MLASTVKQLEDEIVVALSAHPAQTAAALHQKVQSERRYSIQALYKELRKLESNGVVVKKRGQYSLRLPWVLSMQSLAKDIEEKYIHGVEKMTVLPDVGKKQILHFSNLLQLNNYWAQVLVVMMQHATQKRIFTYMPHPWYHLVYTKEEQQYIEAIKKTRTNLYIINRHKTYLDTWAKKFWENSHIEYSFSEKPFSLLPNNIYLNVIDDYVLTVKLGKSIASDIENLYTRTKAADDVDYSEVFHVFNQKVKTTLWLEKNAKKAKQIYGVFRRHFGFKK